MWYMDVKCTGVSVTPGLLLVVSSIKYTSVSLPQYVPYLYVKKKHLQWKRTFGYQAGIVKILLKLCELLGDIVDVWDVLEASSKPCGSSLVLAKVFRLVVKELKVPESRL